MESSERQLIIQVADDFEIFGLSEYNIEKAHKFASDASKDDYYYRLKEFFNS